MLPILAYAAALLIAPYAAGAEAPPTATSVQADEQRLLDLVYHLRENGKLAEARELAEKGLAAAEREAPDQIRTAKWLQELGLTLQAQGRHVEAEARLKRALEIVEKRLGADSRDAGLLAADLASLYLDAARYADAEKFCKRSLAIAEKTGGPKHPDTAASLTLLAILYYKTGRLAEAEPLYQRALAIDLETKGPDHLDTATSLGNLAELYRTQGRFAEAEPLLKRAIAIEEKRRGPDGLSGTTFLRNLATLYVDMERYEDAEQLYRRVLAIREKTLGDHPETANVLGDYCNLLSKLARYTEAESLCKRSLAIQEKILGPAHPEMALSLQNLATVYRLQGKRAEARPLYERALVIFEKVLAPDAEYTIIVVNNLADIYREEGRIAQAETMYKRVLAASAKTLPPEHARIVAAKGNLGGVYLAADRFPEAEQLFRSALAALSKSLPADHPQVGMANYWLARSLLEQQKYDEALRHARVATEIMSGVKARAAARERTGGYTSELLLEPVFEFQARDAFALGRKASAADAAALRNEAFMALQHALADTTSNAVANMAARFATKNDALAALLREQQSLLKHVRPLDLRLAAAMGSNDPKQRQEVQSLRAKSDEIGKRLAVLDQTLRRDHKAYGDLVDPKPLSIRETQALLQPDEAIVVLYQVAEAVITIAVSSSQDAWSATGASELVMAGRVASLRRQLDPDNWESSFAPFDRATALSIYQDLIAPIEPVIKDKAQVFVIANGPLTSLPLSVLVTEQPNGGKAGDVDPTALRDTAWLIKRHALINLPAISSLKALRLYANRGTAPEPFAGFGDPVFATAANRAQSRRSVASLHRGTEPKLDDLRQLTRLPETANELKVLARTLGASEVSDVYLGARANEAQVKSLDLSRKRVIAFATHGFMAGDMGAGEPGLAFSPPLTATATDNGYLSASEAAGLNLHADWVILSACNTAAGSAPGAKGFSGLTRAFFLAGARSLLVSHWPVWDDTAPRLTGATVKAFQADPKLGRAGALRKAMLELMADKSDPRFAHPAAWAPFALAGETRAN